VFEVFMGKGELSTALTIALAVSCVLLFDPIDIGIVECLESYNLESYLFSGSSLLGSASPFLLRTSRTGNYGPKKRSNSRGLRAKISIFKGREAKLNIAIFKCLEINGDLAIGEIQRHLIKQKNLEGTYYASINKRIHCLETAGYIIQASYKESQSGFKAKLYKLHAKAHLAIFLNQTSPEKVLNTITENDATIVLTTLIEIVAHQKRE
jgi:hypothetical protein